MKSSSINKFTSDAKAREALLLRADDQDQWDLLGDERGTYGMFPPSPDYQELFGLDAVEAAESYSEKPIDARYELARRAGSHHRECECGFLVSGTSRKKVRQAFAAHDCPKRKSPT